MKQKNYIEDPHLKKNPFTVPPGYFNEMRSQVAEKISSAGRSPKTGFITVIRPQLALVSAFVIIFFIGYAALTIFTPRASESDLSTLTAGNQYIEEGFLKTTFIDFFDVDGENETADIHTIPSEEVISYISENIDIITLTSLE
ncbi:MAG: hypothetical protein A2X19_02245 [Bacteroidetes bacterium GWE2_39_28]|nr:MAG: hypothetical protein A2X19_02245 [Bacteroidetes bacterium GWE2_39_28]OFY12048.1 MAG: hypothetical protein A2X16_05875 [Bacteroidetes bacterium GWF2_39_10]OFZ09014.1 MAG: hypothetical protein A2322_03295 [Bacteroidetes bacterium RIFOXYB2_FULL_39_7]OFZ11303.1 MAG: hypothetical protein A2465_09225 [Bacteroidetes bacterium RIFOXYC2_FULL_39_11]HCT95156.1 hypothetical protein [Rikenellaceae bacterium]